MVLSNLSERFKRANSQICQQTQHYCLIKQSFNIIMGQKVHPLGFRLGVSQEHNSHWFAKNQQYSQFVIEDHFLREYLYSKFPNAGIASIHIERQLYTIVIHISSARPRQLLGSFYKEKELYKGVNELRDQMTTKLKAYRNYISISKKQSRNIKSEQANFSEKRIEEEATPLDQHVDSGSFGSPGPEVTPKAGGASYDSLPRKRGKQTQESSSSLIDITGAPTEISIHLTKVSDPDSSAACLAEFIVEQLERRVAFRRVIKQAVQRAEKASVKGIKVQVSGRLNGAEIARSERIHKGQVPLHTLRAKMEYKFRTAKTIYGLLGVKVWVFKGFV